MSNLAEIEAKLATLSPRQLQVLARYLPDPPPEIRADAFCLAVTRTGDGILLCARYDELSIVFGEGHDCGEISLVVPKKLREYLRRCLRNAGGVVA